MKKVSNDINIFGQTAKSSFDEQN